jgi:hypothetical protein
LSKETRCKIERLLSSYRNIDAIIKSIEEDLPETKLTPNYEASESQRTNQFNSSSGEYRNGKGQAGAEEDHKE